MKTINLTSQLQHGMINLNYVIGSILIWVYSKKHNENIDNPSMKIYVNKIENRIIFRIKTRYHLELLTPETMKLLGSTEKKITKDKNSKNVPHLEIAGVV